MPNSSYRIPRELLPAQPAFSIDVRLVRRRRSADQSVSTLMITSFTSHVSPHSLLA
jgi:hypothetical protein